MPGVNEVVDDPRETHFLSAALRLYGVLLPLAAVVAFYVGVVVTAVVSIAIGALRRARKAWQQ